MTLEDCRDMITECRKCFALTIRPEQHALWHARQDQICIAIDAISARLADVQQHPALSVPPLPGFE